MIDINSLRDRENPEVFSVTDLNNYIKRIFESNRTLCSVSVRGEISNFVNHRSGHLYFSLKDTEGQIRAVMFRSRAASLKFMPESGMKVIVHGSITVYPRDGSYQIYVSSMQPDGIGALYLAYEQLKAKLAEEGLFDDDHKLPIPYIPRRIGVITSPTGAAVRDILNVTGRRFPGADVYLYPALVQGECAEDSLVKALDYLDNSRLCDVIIIGRGGGSIEDLWAFNGERLARRIYSATTPIISAVGHETDFTICDFVSDLRAPTPSAAAEIAVPDIKELLLRIDGYSERISTALVSRTERSRERYESLLSRVDVKLVDNIIAQRRNFVERNREKADLIIQAMIAQCRETLAKNASKLDALSPLSTLSRGYSLAEHNNRILMSVDQVKIDDEISLTLSSGKIKARVTETIVEK